MATHTHPREWLGPVDDVDGILATTLDILDRVNRRA